MMEISPQTLQLLGWTLLHFLWQGAALAALLALLLIVSRRAPVRYAAGVATLSLMMVAPVITFGALSRAQSAATHTPSLVTAGVPAAVDSGREVAAPQRILRTMALGTGRGDMMHWLVQAWFLGVMLLSARTAGGLCWLARARRSQIEALPEPLHLQCLELQHRMNLRRPIRYGYCHWLDAPAVLGWLRPVVLVTGQALTGLSTQQLQAIIAHELAHIRRFDAFVNLFQILAEMLLFYHPAVWWVNRKIRIEREVCCDQEALAACGEPVSYARALTLMEQWRAAPRLAMAANRGPLTERVLRLLGLQGPSMRTRMVAVGVNVLGVATALFAGYVFMAVFMAAAQATTDPASIEQPEPVEPAEPVAVPEPPGPPEPLEPAVPPKSVAAPASSSRPAPASRPRPLPAPSVLPAEPASPSRPEAVARPSYIEGLAAAGFGNLTVDELIAMKVQGITPAYVQGMRAAQLSPGVDDLIKLKVLGVTPEYVADVQRLVAAVDLEHIITMKIHGITPQLIRELEAAGLEARSADDFIAAKVHGITTQLIKSAIARGLEELTVERLLLLQRGGEV
jgi:beta-lactamase regulating signal transducer with metallopeptidase domain